MLFFVLGEFGEKEEEMKNIEKVIMGHVQILTLDFRLSPRQGYGLKELFSFPFFLLATL